MTRLIHVFFYKKLHFWGQASSFLANLRFQASSFLGSFLSDFPPNFSKYTRLLSNSVKIVIFKLSRNISTYYVDNQVIKSPYLLVLLKLKEGTENMLRAAEIFLFYLRNSPFCIPGDNLRPRVS